MKRILILAYDFPPYVSVGALRPDSWYKYMEQQGLYPIIITRQWDNKFGNYKDYISKSNSPYMLIEESEQGTVIRTTYQSNIANKLLLKYGSQKFALIRKFFTAYYELMQWVRITGPKANLYKAARYYLQNNKVDAIIATGEPFILFRYASLLSKEFNTPWIADYRDTWVQNFARQKNAIIKWLNRYFEKKNLQNVSAISTVSVFIKKKIEENIKSKKFLILTNGYDPEIIEKTKNIKPDNSKFSIAFAGTLYRHHPIEIFLDTCHALVEEGEMEKFELSFIGTNANEELEQLVEKKYPLLKNKIHFHPKLSNVDLAAMLAAHQMFLLLNDFESLGTKIFDYLALRRKIIFCFENDPEANELKKKYFAFSEGESERDHRQSIVILQTNSGVLVKDRFELKQTLMKLYEEFETNGQIVCESKNIEKFSRKEQVKSLVAFVNDVANEYATHIIKQHKS